MEEKCSIDRIEHGMEVYVYHKIDVNGEPMLGERNYEDLEASIKDRAYNELWDCSNCGEQFETWEACRKHLEAA